MGYTVTLKEISDAGHMGNKYAFEATQEGGETKTFNFYDHNRDGYASPEEELIRSSLEGSQFSATRHTVPSNLDQQITVETYIRSLDLTAFLN